MVETRKNRLKPCVCRAYNLPNSGRLPHVQADLQDEEHPCREAVINMSIPAYQIGAAARVISDIACQLQVEGGVCPRGFKREIPESYQPNGHK